MSKKDYKQVANEILEKVGGSDNVVNLEHCVTRLRFTLKDSTIADTESIKKISLVLSVVESSGQYQVVIGPSVNKVYDEIEILIGQRINNASNTDNKSNDKNGIFGYIAKLISGIMMPVMPAILGCGLVSCLVVLLTTAGLSTESGTYTVLYGIGQTWLYFLPVIIGGSTAKFFGINTYIGNIIGAAMIYPSFVQLAGSTVNFIEFIPLTFRDYTSSVFPVIGAVWVASIIYKFLENKTPDALKFMCVPFFTVLLSVPLALLAIGPVIDIVSNVVATTTIAIYDFSPLFCAIILGATWGLFIVPLGLHYAFIPIFINNIATLGYEPIMGLLCGILGFAGTLVAVGIKSKNIETKSLAYSTALTSALGISEPGLYGVILLHKETMIATALGGAIASIIPVFFHTYVYAMSGSGIFSLVGSMNPDGSMGSLIGAVLCNVVAFILCFAFTMLQKFDPDNIKE